MTDPAARTGRSGWNRSSWAMVKTTGFGYEQLEVLTDPRASRAARSGADDTEIEKALAANVSNLLRACHDDRVAEAIFLSSPGANQAVTSLRKLDPDAGGLKSKDKSRLITLGMYFQRLCTKNESTSFFGPVHWARITETGDTVVQPSTADPIRGVFFAHWAVQHLADLVSTDDEVAQHLVPRLPPNLFARGDSVLRRVEFVENPIQVVDVLPPGDHRANRIWQLCDGDRTARELAAAAGIAVAEVVAELRQLEDQGLVRFTLEIPIGIAEPMDHLQAFLDGLPAATAAPWLERVRELRAGRDGFAAASGYPERQQAMRELGSAYSSISGTGAERNAGQLAADRAVIIEDCVAGWPRFDLGGALTGYLDDELPRVLDLFYELPLARRRARIGAIQEWFDGRFPEETPIPLDDVLLASEAEGHALGRALREIDDHIRREGPSAITDQLWLNSHESRVDLDLAWADQERSRMPFDAWCVSGVDLFVAAESTDAINRGDFQGVVGEIHALHDQLVQGLWPRLHPDPAALAREIGQRVAAVSPFTMCDPTLPHRRKTMAREDVLAEIEFTQASPRPAGRRMRSGDLSVLSRAGHLELTGEPLGPVALTRPPLWWWDAEVESIFSAFTGARIANMVDTVRSCDKYEHLPRLTVGKTVLSRETWWYTPTGRRSKYVSLSPANQRSVIGLKDELGLPDQVFVRFAEEPKPVFIDFDMPYLVDLFARLLSHTDQRIEIGEMVPGPNQLWLRDERGRHPAELRIGYYRAADPTAGGQS
jgi:hypothetical protein